MIEKFVNLRPEVRQNIYDYFREVVSAFVYGDMEPQEMSSPQNKHDRLLENEVAQALSESLATQPQEKSLEELEAEYKKSRSVSARKKESSALNITAETNTEKSKGVHKKVSGK